MPLSGGNLATILFSLSVSYAKSSQTHRAPRRACLSVHLSGSLVAQTPPASSLTHLRVLLGHVLLGELGKLHQLGDDLLDIVAVGAVHQGGCHGVQDGLVRGLESQGRGTRRSKAERKLEN